MSQDRPLRRYPRAPCGAKVQLWRQRDPIQIQAMNISQTGIFLRTNEQLHAGQYITLRIALPYEERSFTALCRVVRTDRGRVHLRSTGHGIEFIDVNPRHARLIEAYVHHVNARTGGPGRL